MDAWKRERERERERERVCDSERERVEYITNRSRNEIQLMGKSSEQKQKT
jgi:hypothetical protein